MAFVADLDAQFIFVPKSWVRYILMIKILRVQASLIYDETYRGGPVNRHLTSDKFIKNGNLIYKLRGLNNSNVDSIFR